MQGANILKNSLNKARNTMKRPNWLVEDVWDNLCQHWGSKPFKVKSLVAKERIELQNAKDLVYIFISKLIF